MDGPVVLWVLGLTPGSGTLLAVSHWQGSIPVPEPNFEPAGTFRLNR